MQDCRIKFSIIAATFEIYVEWDAETLWCSSLVCYNAVVLWLYVSLIWHTQFSSWNSFLKSYWSESGVLNEENIQKVQSSESLRPELRTTVNHEPWQKDKVWSRTAVGHRKHAAYRSVSSMNASFTLIPFACPHWSHWTLFHSTIRIYEGCETASCLFGGMGLNIWLLSNIVTPRILEQISCFLLSDWESWMFLNTCLHLVDFPG